MGGFDGRRFRLWRKKYVKNSRVPVLAICRVSSICTMPVSTRSRCRARGGGRGVPAAAAAAAVLMLAAALPGAAALYTKVKQGQQKCFIELLHADNVVVAEYRSPDQAPLPHDAEGQRGHVGVLFQVVNHRG